MPARSETRWSSAPGTWGERYQAWLLRRLDGWSDRVYHNFKHPLFRPICGKVVEIGAGSGTNLEYYPPGTRVTAVEPNGFLRRRLHQRARMAGVKVRVLTRSADRMLLDDASVDHVVGTLVLCTVQDPAAVLAEIRRILKPGGSFYFMEHVHGTGWTGVSQNLLELPWRWMFGGCRLNRDTESTIRDARIGWEFVSRCEIGPRSLPIRPHIIGRVVRSERTPLST